MNSSPRNSLIQAHAEGGFSFDAIANDREYPLPPEACRNICIPGSDSAVAAAVESESPPLQPSSPMNRLWRISFHYYYYY